MKGILKRLGVICLAAIVGMAGCELPVGSGAVGGGEGGLPPGPENPAESEVVLLNRHMTNYLLYGTDILNSKLAELSAITQKYGVTGGQEIKKIINAQLTPSMSQATNRNNAFNYSAFDAFKDVSLYTKDAAGNYTLLSDVPITPAGSFDSEARKNEIKGKIYALKAKLAQSSSGINPAQDFTSFTNKMSEFFNNYQSTFSEIKNFFGVNENSTGAKLEFNKFIDWASNLTKTLAEAWKKISWLCPVVSFFIDLVCPSQSEQVIDIMQQNFQVVFQYLDGIIEYLDLIDQKLNSIHDEVVLLGYNLTNNHLTMLRNKLDATLNYIRNPGLTDQERMNKIEDFNGEIDTLILNYISQSELVYDYYKRKFLMDESNGGVNKADEMKNFAITVELPIDEKTYSIMKQGAFEARLAFDMRDPYPDEQPPPYWFVDGGVSSDTKKLVLTFDIPSPNKWLPYDPSMLKYLHEILLARFQMNTAWKKDVTTLNLFNKEIALWLSTWATALPVIRNNLTQAHDQMEDELESLFGTVAWQSQTALIQNYLQALNGDWEFNAIKKSENYYSMDYTPSMTIAVYDFIPCSEKTFGGVKFWTSDAVSRNVGYYVPDNWYRTYGSFTTSQNALANNNPYKFVICSGYIGGGDEIPQVYGLPRIQPVPAGGSSPSPASIYPRFYNYEFNDYYKYYYPVYTAAPAKLPTRILHEPKQAVVKIKSGDGTEVVDISQLTFNNYDMVAKIRTLMEETYRARATKMVQLLTDLVAMEVDMECYINDPGNSSY